MKSTNLSPLKGFNSFTKVYEQSLKIHFGNIFLQIVLKPSDILIKKKICQPDLIYFGVVAPKKIYKKAVVRNRIKRLLRVSLKEIMQRLSTQYDFSKIQIIVITWKSNTISKPQEIRLIEVKENLFQAINYFLLKNPSLRKLNHEQQANKTSIN
jgi:ribonuclease P protein component